MAVWGTCRKPVRTSLADECINRSLFAIDDDNDLITDISRTERRAVTIAVTFTLHWLAGCIALKSKTAIRRTVRAERLRVCAYSTKSAYADR